MYTYIYIMSRRTQITFTDVQHRLLLEESARSDLPMAELVRRAVDAVYRPHSRRNFRGWEVLFSVWRQPDAAIVSRLVRVRKPRLTEEPRY